MVAVSRRVKLLGLIVGLVLATAAFSLSGSIGSGGRGQVTLSNIEPWPAFSMKYREEGRSTYDVWLFDYVDRRHWRAELLESTRDPRSIGSWQSLDGITVTFYSLPESDYDVTQIPIGNYAKPNEWLDPRGVGRLLSKGYRQVESGLPDRLRFVRTEIATSPDGVKHRGTEEWTFTKEHGIPVEMVATQDDGQVYRHITILSLTFK